MVQFTAEGNTGSISRYVVLQAMHKTQASSIHSYATVTTDNKKTRQGKDRINHPSIASFWSRLNTFVLPAGNIFEGPLEVLPRVLEA